MRRATELHRSNIWPDGGRSLEERPARSGYPSGNALESTGKYAGVFASMWLRDGSVLQGREFPRGLSPPHTCCVGRWGNVCCCLNRARTPAVGCAAPVLIACDVAGIRSPRPVSTNSHQPGTLENASQRRACDKCIKRCSGGG